MYLLIPGRHQLLTKFQYEYLSDILTNPSSAKDINGKSIGDIKIDAIIFAVTSANHSNTRRNPLPFYIRALMIESFSNDISVPCFIYGIDDVGSVSNFSQYTLKRIHHESEGMFELTPDNTLLVCSTPVLEMYERDGFRILPAELQNRNEWRHHTVLPWDVVETIAMDPTWFSNPVIYSKMHSSSIDIWKKYRLGEKVRLLFGDKMISDDGDITTTRDYNTYVR